MVVAKGALTPIITSDSVITILATGKEDCMKTIRISDEVWKAFERHGKFGETPDDVLRRAFGLSGIKKRSGSTWNKIATNRMLARVASGELRIEFASGASRQWALPSKEDKAGIRKVRSDALRFAEGAGATTGQLNAVLKALTEGGYHLTK